MSVGVACSSDVPLPTNSEASRVLKFITAFIENLVMVPVKNYVFWGYTILP
jgi:hypothetical protein